MPTTKPARARKKAPRKPQRRDVGQLKRLIEVLELIDELVAGSPDGEVAAIRDVVPEAAALIESTGLADIAVIPESDRPVFEVKEDDRGNLRLRWADPDPKYQDQQRDCLSHIRASTKRWRRMAIRMLPPKPPPTVVEPKLPDQLVTLDQMSAITRGAVSKRTLERHKRGERLPKLPAPDVEGGDGKAHKWSWATVRPVLEEIAGIRLPERFPARYF